MPSVTSASSSGVSLVTQYTNREIYDVQNNPAASVRKEAVIAQLRDELTKLQGDKDVVKGKLQDLMSKSSVTADELAAAKKDVAQAVGRFNQVENQLAYLDGQMSGVQRGLWERAVLNPPGATQTR